MSSERKEPKVADRDVPGTARRNRYFSGKLLTVADYVLEQRYHIERRWLINRMLHGWGVVSGLEVEQRAGGGWRVSAGMALDRQGRELIVHEALDLEDDDDLVWLTSDGRIEPARERSGAGNASYLLSAHYTERRVDGVLVDDDLGDGVCEANRLCETVVFSLARDSGEARDEVAAADLRGLGRLTRIGRLDVDLGLPVPLARVTASFPDSGPPVLDGVDETYRPRPLGRSSAPPPAGRAEPTEPRTGGPLRVEHRAVPAPAPPPAEGDQL